MRKVIGYLRVSTADQDTVKNEAAVLRFANERNLGHVQFVSEKVSGLTSWRNRLLGQTVDQMEAGDVMIVPELSRLGRSIADVLQVLSILSDKNCKVYSVKEGFQLNGTDMQSKVMRVMFSLLADIDSDLRSARTKEGLIEARKSGRMLGRPKGPGRSKLDEYRDEIITQLRNGVTKKHIALLHGVTPATLHNWIKMNKFSHIKPTL